MQKTHEGGYLLGNAMLVLGTAASMQIDLVKIAGPVLESLALKAYETVQLRIRDNTEALCIAKAEPSRDLRVHAVVGRRRPLYAGSSKVLLAFLPEDLRNELLPISLDSMTARTITERAKLVQELETIRATGYCISRGEVSEQLVSVSLPVRGYDGSVLAAINIAAPAFRTQEADLDRYRSLLVEGAAKISAGLGWSR
ncbi:IclR family transcriptional regulator [Puniceibacterium sediminis]|uniref:IclR family transcriptional regulator n=1 Tax=Puniceibacterium sediminis TaxID=1608407 RepID=UPI001FEC6334|nr:IclR family transcriptional regulator [Puniceibacterium sediminis]